MFLAALLFLLGRVLKILIHRSRQKFAEIGRMVVLVNSRKFSESILSRAARVIGTQACCLWGGRTSMSRLRAATPNSESVREQGVFADRGRHGDQDGQAEQAAR